MAELSKTDSTKVASAEASSTSDSAGSANRSRPDFFPCRHPAVSAEMKEAEGGSHTHFLLIFRGNGQDAPHQCNKAARSSMRHAPPVSRSLLFPGILCVSRRPGFIRPRCPAHMQGPFPDSLLPTTRLKGNGIRRNKDITTICRHTYHLAIDSSTTYRVKWS
jgi:hypothetical protein